MKPGFFIDVRAIAIPERHAHIVRALEEMRDGQTLRIISDHEPRPLRAELDKTFARQVRWGQSNLGDGRWEARITKLHIADRSPTEAALLRCDAFTGAMAATLRDFADFARRTAIKRHHCVVEQGVDWPYVGLVDTGVVQAQFCSASGREQVLYDLLPGDIFAEPAFMDGGHTALRYIALTAQTVVVLLPVERLRAATHCDSNVRSGVERSAAQHLRSTVERLTEVRFLSSTARIAAVLLPYASPQPGLRTAADPLPAMTQIEVSIEAGSAKEVVSRALRELESAGAIERERGRLIKLDRDRLVAAIRY